MHLGGKQEEASLRIETLYQMDFKEVNNSQELHYIEKLHKHKRLSDKRLSLILKHVLTTLFLDVEQVVSVMSHTELKRRCMDKFDCNGVLRDSEDGVPVEKGRSLKDIKEFDFIQCGRYHLN